MVFGYDDSRFGAHAEYITIGEHAGVATMPDDRDFEVMAPALEGSHYALAYIRAARVDDGSEVLVYGATGAIGWRPCRSSRASARTWPRCAAVSTSSSWPGSALTGSSSAPPTPSVTTSSLTPSESARSASAGSC